MFLPCQLYIAHLTCIFTTCSFLTNYQSLILSLSLQHVSFLPIINRPTNRYLYYMCLLTNYQSLNLPVSLLHVSILPNINRSPYLYLYYMCLSYQLWIANLTWIFTTCVFLANYKSLTLPVSLLHVSFLKIINRSPYLYIYYMCFSYQLSVAHLTCIFT